MKHSYIAGRAYPFLQAGDKQEFLNPLHFKAFRPVCLELRTSSHFHCCLDDLRGPIMTSSLVPPLRVTGRSDGVEAGFDATRRTPEQQHNTKFCQVRGVSLKTPPTFQKFLLQLRKSPVQNRLTHLVNQMY